MNDLAARLTAAEREFGTTNTRPRDAATLIVVDRSQKVPTVLMGRRHPGQRFMPGKFVFPGGRLERSDAAAPLATPLHPKVEERLRARIPAAAQAKAPALAAAAIRETAEETGMLIGVKDPAAVRHSHPAWSLFANHGIALDLGALHLVARAITPPRRPVRFDARFFAADAAAIVHRIDGIVGPDAEFVELAWVPIAEAKHYPLPTITQAVLEELEARTAAGFGHDLPVPFYYMRRGRFHRELI